MDYSHQLHVVVPVRGGVQLWVERVEGRQVITGPGDLKKGDLPAVCLNVVRDRPWRVRGKVDVATPKGVIKTLPVPTVALTPEDAIPVLGKLCEYANGYAGAVPGLSPEVVFLLDLFRFVDDTVRAGRVMLRMEHVDGQWFPHWTLSTAGDHHLVLQKFRDSVPEVLVRNGGADVVERFADEFAHWLAVSYLRRAEGERGDVSSAFIRSLVTGAPARRMNPDTVVKLNQWRESARIAASQIVFVLSSPDDAITLSTLEPDEVTPADVSWRLDIAMSVNDGPVEPVIPAEVRREDKERIDKALREARRAWPELGEHFAAVDGWLNTGVWFPPPNVITGSGMKDRVLSIGMDMDFVVEFLDKGVRELQKAGFRVMVPRAWARVKPDVTVTATPVGQGSGSSKVGLDQLVDFSWNVSVGGERLDESARQDLLNTATRIVRLNGTFVFVDDAALAGARRWFRDVAEAVNEDKGGKGKGEGGGDGGGDAESVVDELMGGNGQVTLRDIMEADALSAADRGHHDHDFSLVAEGWASRILGEGPQIDPPRPVEVPATVVTRLRDHQRRGLNWLVWMHEHGLGAVLADDMGLGKTLQVLALVAWEREQNEAAGPTLVIAPTSVVQAWKDEAALHTPSLRVHVDHGSSRPRPADFLRLIDGTEDEPPVDIVVTTYGTVQRNPERYWAVTWGRIVADEAQAIKNPNAKQSRAVRNIPAKHHLALTGTPVENRLADLFAIMDFANPGILGSHSAFQHRLAVPIERHGDDYARQRLQRLVQPFILRRLKTDAAVGLNLPEKSTIVEKVPLSREQAALYEAYVHDLEERLSRRKEKRRGAILGALVRFKQICDHPALFAGDGSPLMKNGRHRSMKVKRIFEIVNEALLEGRRVLLFTQFPSFGRLLIPEMEREFAMDIPMLHGGLSRAQRTRLVEEFQSEDGPKVMVLSVRAGGTGITLTKASVVVHMDRWWNPAVEDQATDRAYRIGQEKDVTVYKLVAQGTIDEHIHDIISGKRELAGDIVGMGEGWIANLDDDDLSELIHLRVASKVHQTQKRRSRFSDTDVAPDAAPDAAPGASAEPDATAAEPDATAEEEDE